MPSRYPRTAILHYSVPPVVGGVEAVIAAHARIFCRSGYPVTIVSGRGEQEALADTADLIVIPEMDSQHAEIVRINVDLERGEVPPDFEKMVFSLSGTLIPLLSKFEMVIAHNLFTKHFNLPLTAALYRLLDQGIIQNCIAWCHDFSWTSPHSRKSLHPGYPWDLLRTYRPDVSYVVVSRSRQRSLTNLLKCPLERIHVIYNGVDPTTLLGLSHEASRLVQHLGLMESDLVLLMPVRVTRAKNIEFALHVLAALKEHGCQPKLVLTGPPDPHDGQSMAYFRSLQDLRRELGVEQHMHFVFDSGPDSRRPYYIDSRVVGDLFRVSDVMFMPSFREGFGMPVLEAGLIGLPVVSTRIPASVEIGAPDIAMFEPGDAPEQVARLILDIAQGSPLQRFRRRVRRNYTWQAIFEMQIEPLLYPQLNESKIVEEIK